jgi:hypothetical protein
MSSIRKTIARKILARCEQIQPNMKGKKLDDAAINMVCGAVFALEAAGLPAEAEKLTNDVFMVSVRGASWIIEVASAPDEADKS